MIKSLVISTVYGGGAGRACLRLHEALLEHPGVDPHALVGQFPPDHAVNVSPVHNTKLELILRRRWTKFIAARTLRGRPATEETFLNPRTGYAVHRHPLVREADIINLHWTTRFLDHRSFFANVKKPIVWTLHDMNPWSGGYPYDKDFPIEAYQDLITANLKYQAAALKDVDNLTVVAPSRWLHDLSKASGLFGRFRHECIPYSLDVGTFKPVDQSATRVRLGLPTNKKVILFVASYLGHKRKGFQHLVAALEILRKRVSTDDVCLAVVGSGNLSALPEGFETIELGRITEERKMAEIYAAADMFVIPSEQDNLPNTVIESLSTGTPVTGFAVGGIPDMVEAPELGYLAPRIDAGELAAAMEKMLQTDFDRAYIRANAVRRYSPSVQANAYHALFEDMLS
jgi:glycosyltransferase involved in cell wall biosynthesis